MHVHSLLGAGVLEPLRQLEHVELAGCRVVKYLARFMVGDHARKRYSKLLASCCRFRIACLYIQVLECSPRYFLTAVDSPEG